MLNHMHVVLWSLVWFNPGPSDTVSSGTPYILPISKEVDNLRKISNIFPATFEKFRNVQDFSDPGPLPEAVEEGFVKFLQLKQFDINPSWG